MTATVPPNFPTKAMILAAGEGTRLRPLTNSMPKCMVPLAGVPILEKNILWMRKFGIQEMVINLFYMPDAVRDYFGDGSNWGIKIYYSHEEQLLGTAGGLKKVEDFFDEPFLVWYGDNLSRVNLHRLYDFHKDNEAAASIALFYRENPTASGIVGLDEYKRITRFLEKPKWEEVFSHWVSAGVIFLEPETLSYIPEGIASDFGKDIFPAMLAASERLFGYQLSDEEGLWWVDTPTDLSNLQEEMARRNILQ